MSEPSPTIRNPVGEPYAEKPEAHGISILPEVIEARKALRCLFAAVKEKDVAMDVSTKVEAAFRALAAAEPEAPAQESHG